MYSAILLARLLPSFLSLFLYHQQHYYQPSMTSFCSSNIMKLNTIQIKNCHKAAQKDINSLLHCNDDNKFKAKLFDVCDTFKKYNDERPISVEWLLSSQVKPCLSVST